VIVEKNEKEENELHQVKLRKVKIEKIKKETQQIDAVDDGQPKSVKDLLSIFGGANNAKRKSSVIIKRTVIEEGNVGKTGKKAGANAKADADGEGSETEKFEPIVEQSTQAEQSDDNSSDEAEVEEQPDEQEINPALI